MRKTLTVVLVGIVGLVVGITAHHYAPRTAVAKSSEPVPVVVFEKPKSAESLESLLALDDSVFHDRAALWLLDATPAGLADFWAACKKRGGSNRWLMDFLFVRWLAIDPDAAEKAAGEEGMASLRWAQAVKEPESMLSKVALMSPKETAAVMQALSDFHPQTAMKVLGAHPGLATPEAIGWISLRLAADDPEKALKLVRLYNMGHPRSVMRKWTRKDPNAALEWLKSQPATSVEDPLLDDFIAALVDDRPELLKEIALKLPAGRIRREIERAVFMKFIETDPEEALGLARGTEAPRIAAERLAEIGRRQMKAQPDLAWALFADLIEKCPDALLALDRIYLAGGFSTEIVQVRGVKEFTTALLDSDAARALDTALAVQKKNPGGKAVGWQGVLPELADDWTVRDLESFIKWLESQPPGPVRDGGSGLVAWTFANRQNFTEAMRWAMGIENEEQRVSRLQEVASQWARHDANKLTAWIKAVEISDEIRDKLMETLEEEQ